MLLAALIELFWDTASYENSCTYRKSGLSSPSEIFVFSKQKGGDAAKNTKSNRTNHPASLPRQSKHPVLFPRQHRFVFFLNRVYVLFYFKQSYSYFPLNRALIRFFKIICYFSANLIC